MRPTARRWFGKSRYRRRGHTVALFAFTFVALGMVVALASDEQSRGPSVEAAGEPATQGVQAARVAATTTNAPPSTAPPTEPSLSTDDVSSRAAPIANEMRRVVSTTRAAAAPMDTAAPRQVGVSAPAPPPSTPTSTSSIPAPPTTVVTPKNCVVRLHGKGATGAPTTSANGVTYLYPTGNTAGWGGRQWMYYPSASFAAARAVVAATLDDAGCTRVILDGFSNGAAFAAKLYCSTDTFGGRLVRVIIDDPVTDHAVGGCAGAPGVALTLYWTGALEGQAVAGWDCRLSDWTCEGGSTVGIAAYAAALSTTLKQSPMGGHSAYTNPPELTQF